MFGARAGPHTKIRRTVRIDQPWNFTAGELVMIGDDASFVAVRPIRLGNFAVVSQMANVVTEVLDVRRPDGARFQGAVTIESQCWVAADALVLPGTHLKEGAVVGARSVAQGEVSAWTVVAGDPARFLRPRPWKGTTGAAR